MGTLDSPEMAAAVDHPVRVITALSGKGFAVEFDVLCTPQLIDRAVAAVFEENP